MSCVADTNRLIPRWLHIWAIVTVSITPIALVLGGLVTTYRVGMADPVWPTTPWYLFFTSWSEPRPGFLIEHAHRLGGYIVGCFVAVLGVGMASLGRTSGLRWFGIACLIAVILQGMLGGFRVVLHELIGPNLAMIHGCFAQVVFSLLVGAVVVSAPLSDRPELSFAERTRFRRLAFALIGIVGLQLIWGALVRHNPGPLVQRLHLLTACAVVAIAAATIQRVQSSSTARHRLGRTSIILGILLALQVVLGIEAWMGKFSSGVLPELQKVATLQVLIRAGHVLVGTGIMATSFSLVLLTRPIPKAVAESTYPAPLAVGSTPRLARAESLGGAS